MAEGTVLDNNEVSGGTRFHIGNIGGNERTRGNRRSGSDGSESDATQGQSDAGESEQSVPIVTSSPRVRQSRAGSQNQAAAEMLTGVIETLAVMRYGANPAVKIPDGTDGRMLQRERAMITSGIAGSMSSLPASVTKQITQLSSPVMAAMGLLFYAQRLSVLEIHRRANFAEMQRSAQAGAVMEAERLVNQSTTPQAQQSQQPPSTNGRAPNTPPDLDTIRGIME